MSRVKVIVEKIMFYPPSKGYAILLKEVDSTRELPIIVGVFEAQSIALALENIRMPRPLTHDLFTNILNDLNIQIEEMMVSDLRDGTFYAELLLKDRKTNEMFKIDSRPSDAIAIALRVNAPMYVAYKVIEEAGQEIPVDSEPKSTETDVPEIKNLTRLSELQSRLQEAIDNENYELAAKLRDQISQIEKDSLVN